MKRQLLFAVVAVSLLLGSASAARAEVRLDFDIPVIVAAGVTLSDLTGSSSDITVDLSNLHIPLPYIELAYQFGDTTLRGGFGLRTYTVLIEFIGWPMGYVELQLDQFILRAELGGFGFFFLGVANQIFVNSYTLSTVIPDVQLSYAIAPWFRAGVGVLAVAPISNFKNFGWLFYINARFALTFK
jgi:hypothetical protein